MSYSIEHYLQNHPFATRPMSDNFEIGIVLEDKTISSFVDGKIENTLKFKINNKPHQELCIKLLIHLDVYKLLIKVMIVELKKCENDMFLKEKKNLLGFAIALKNKNKKFAIKHFEEWKINSQESSEKLLELSEEGDLYEETPKTIGFYVIIPSDNELNKTQLGVEEENTYIKIQEGNKVNYDDMNNIIQICNICGYWK